MPRIAPGEWSERAIVSIHGTFPPETIGSIVEAMEKKEPFGLTDGEGAVLFSPTNFTLYEIGANKQCKAVNTFQDISALQDAVKMYLAFYIKFIPFQGLIAYIPPTLQLTEK